MILKLGLNVRTMFIYSEDIQKILERIDLFRGGTMEHIKSALFHGIDTLGDIIGNALLHPLETSIHKVHEDLDNVLGKCLCYQFSMKYFLWPG